ncbi:glycosyltransferase family 4 protein [Alkalihalobacillus sp. BA299]|uniref:glycosyltransferase family 4 protein n=1 Tax=Alkalihalobacillus sp. BA299 TaxID=2815938 RepID=UPI001ADCB8CF|nr:glycosyltransferase family 4 protein [Alkalihalobacillus sp. BA299]
MKILIICTEKLPVPPVRGGAIQTYIAGAVPFLSKKHEITILGRNDPSLPDKETKDGIHYVRCPGGLLETYRQGVVEYLKSNSSFDLIHIFNRPRLVSPVRECVPKARIILSMHNDMFKPQKISPEEGALAIEQVDKIITISDYIGKAITELFPEAAPKLKTIYSGVDLDRFVPAYSQKADGIRKNLRREYNLEGKKVILFAGRLSANKGADVLVRAMNILAKKHSNVALVLMGSKWFSDNGVTDYVAYVRALADRSPVPVITTGFVAPDKIQDWFATADIFVCPSQWEEPLARVHYEAMAAGLPIVTTARGGNPEVIEVNKNGLIVANPEDPNEFAEHLSVLLSSSQKCKDMGQYGRKLVEEKFHWNRVENDILAVWTEIEHKIKNNIPINADSTEEEQVLGEEIEEVLDTEAEIDTEIVETIEEVEEEVVEIDEEEEKRKRGIFICNDNPPAPPWLSFKKKAS